jgi:hypothetical protein
LSASGAFQNEVAAKGRESGVGVPGDGGEAGMGVAGALGVVVATGAGAMGSGAADQTGLGAGAAEVIGPPAATTDPDGYGAGAVVGAGRLEDPPQCLFAALPPAPSARKAAQRIRTRPWRPARRAGRRLEAWPFGDLPVCR